jgi:hypothetical protein
VSVGFSIGPGWQPVKVPFATIVPNMYYGGMNEPSNMVDSTGLTQIQWQIQQAVADASAGVPFNFCVYGVSFY